MELTPTTTVQELLEKYPEGFTVAEFGNVYKVTHWSLSSEHRGAIGDFDGRSRFYVESTFDHVLITD